MKSPRNQVESSTVGEEQTKLVEVYLSAYKLVEFKQVIQVPASMSESELDDLVRQRYQDVSADDFVVDDDYWEKSDCKWTEAPADAAPDLVMVHHADGDGYFSLEPAAELLESPDQPAPSLYQSAYAAIDKLIRSFGIKAGSVNLVFDTHALTVTHADVLGGRAPQTKPNEHFVCIHVPESKSVELSVMAAAINAVNALNQRVALAPSERGLPDMKGLMFFSDGEGLRLAPYDEKVLGFAHCGVTIINPALSPNRAYEVDPVKAYGFKELDDGQSGRILVRPHEDGGYLRLSMASNGFVIDRYDAGNQKIAYVFSSKLPDSELGAWLSLMPENFLAHRESWRRGFQRLIELEPEPHRPDEDEKGFWRHELRAFDFAYEELDSLRGVQMQGEAAWEQSLPHDFLSHRGSWRCAFERLIELESGSAAGQYEKEFWARELQAFDAAYQQLDEILGRQSSYAPEPGLA